MTDFRALCVQLADAAREVREYLPDECGTYDLDQALAAVDLAITELDAENQRYANAAALTAEPEPPADGEVAELVAWLCDEADEYDCIQQAPDVSHKLRRAADLLELLAQPEPVGPTDKEIMELMPQQMRDDLATAARAMAGIENPRAGGIMRIILNRHAVDHVRAVLARWGRP